MKEYRVISGILFYFFVISTSYGFQESAKNIPIDLKVLTWNIQDLGRSKNNEEIKFIATILKDYDLVALQEVVAKDPAGAKAVARIADVLNRLGSKWDYSISNPTNSSSSYASERYAYLWKSSKIQLKKRAFLDTELDHKIEREPYIAIFEMKKNNKTFYAINMHARTYNKHPEMEISNFKKYPQRFKTDNLIILGDFNLNEKHTVWNPLYKMGFVSAIANQQTTLKRKCKNNRYLNYPIDNIYYNSNYFKSIKSYVIDFVNECGNLEIARRISDHLPVGIEFVCNTK